MSNKATALIPYLHFGGNCEEALQFYAQVLGGTVEITQRYDNPAMDGSSAVLKAGVERSVSENFAWFGCLILIILGASHSRQSDD